MISHEDTMARRDEEAVSHEDTMTRRDEEVVSHEDTMTRRDEEVVSHEDTMTRRDEEVVSHEDTMARRDEEAVSHEDTMTRRDEEVVSHEDTMARRDEEVVSHEDTTIRRDKEVLSRIVVDCAYRMHVGIGPSLLESVYEAVLEKCLLERGLKVDRQKVVPVKIMGLAINEGFRADLIVEDILLIELKSVETLAPVHAKQVLTYLRLLDLPLGLLINFGAATFKEGCKRIVNGRQDFTTSFLRVNKR